MKKLLLIAILALIGIHITSAQVGIGTETPKTSLQVVGEPSITTTADGVQVPSLSLAQLDAKISAYGTEQDGAIVYIDDVTNTSTTAQTGGINAVGFYYYDADNQTWKTIGNNFTLSDASVTNAKLDKTNIPLSGFGTAQADIDLGSNKILFSNVYSTVNDLPAAGDYHGMFAHVHGTGKAYYAHAGNWVEIANLASPTFTGTPQATTATTGTADTQIATTEFVATAVAGVNAAGLVSITENSNTGYRRADADAANYGDIGVGAVDLSFSKSTGTANGASGLNSIAMGVRTTASGYASSAMGNQTTASGYFSTAMGDRTTASDFGSVVIGQYNSSGSTATSNTSFSASAPAFVIGNGTGSSDLNDAFVVDFSGNTTAGGDITAAGNVFATGVVDASAFVGDGSQLTGITTASIADGSVTSAKILDGTLVNADISTSAAIAQSKIDGLSASLADKADLDSPTFTGTPTLPTGTIGVTQTAEDNTTAVATTEFVATAVAGVDAAGLVSITENGNTGYRRADADAANYGDIGDDAVDLSFSNTIGTRSGASGARSTAMGENTTASGSNSTSIGYHTTASGYNSTAMGFFTTASGQASTAMGEDTKASGKASLAIGSNTTASDFGSLVLGQYNNSGRSETSATSYSANAPALVIGNGTSYLDLNDAFVVDFSGNTTAGGDITAAGNVFATGVVDASAFVGDGSQLTGITTASIADGSVTSAKILDGEIVNADISTTAAIAQSKIDGLSASLADKADLDSPIFTGTPTLPTGTIGVTQTAEDNTTAVATTEFVATALAGVDAAGLVSVTENGNTGYRRADADSDLYYGNIGDGAVDLSVPTDLLTNTGATGEISTAMGVNTTASGYFSTAMGNATTASGYASTAMGNRTTASDFGSVVIGQYNSSGSNATSVNSLSASAPAFVIGNGTDPNALSDAFVVDFTGNTTAGGDITAAGNVFATGVVDASAFVGDGSQLTGITTTSIADASITSAKILDDEIVNADISSSAAIAQSKIEGLGTSLDAKANLDSPTFTGTVTANAFVGDGSGLTDVKDASFDLTDAADGDLLRYDATASKWVKVTPDYISNGDTNVGFGTETPDASAQLELQSTTKGFLPPRMTTINRNDIENPVEGLTIYNTDDVCLNIYVGFGWRNLCAEAGPNDVINPKTGQIWMDRNLGASQVATSSTDADAYGDLYQWGRGADGHQTIVWTSANGSDGAEQNNETSDTSSSTAPGTAFITGSANWYTGSNPDDLWKEDGTGVNDPCPSGYRVPTAAEWEAELGTGKIIDVQSAFEILKLPLAGYRNSSDGSLVNVGTTGFYWSSTVSSSDVRRLNLTSTAYMTINARTFGFSVRCIKE